MLPVLSLARFHKPCVRNELKRKGLRRFTIFDVYRDFISLSVTPVRVNSLSVQKAVVALLGSWGLSVSQESDSLTDIEIGCSQLNLGTIDGETHL